MSKASGNDFKEYELTEVQDLISAIAGSTTKDNVITVMRDIGGKRESFVPSISVRSTVDPSSSAMVPNDKDMKHAKTELGSYLEGLSAQTADKAGAYTVPIVFRVGGETESMIEDGIKGGSGAHYISAVLRHNAGKNELVIMDSLGTIAKPGEKQGGVNDSYQQEVAAITEAFTEQFRGITVTTNPPGTVLQSDPHSCGPVCLYNLESQLTGITPTTNRRLGIEEIGGVLKFTEGAAKLRTAQKDTLELEKALQQLQEESPNPTKIDVTQENPKTLEYRDSLNQHKADPEKTIETIRSFAADPELSKRAKNALLNYAGKEIISKYSAEIKQTITPKIRAIAGDIRDNKEGVTMKSERDPQVKQYIEDFNLSNKDPRYAATVTAILLDDATISEQNKIDVLKAIKDEMTPETLKAYGAEGRKVFGQAFADPQYQDQGFTKGLEELVEKVDIESRYTKSFRVSASNAGARADVVSQVAADQTLTEEGKKALLTEFSTQSFEHTDKEVFQGAIQDLEKKHPGLATELGAIKEASGKSTEVEKEELASDSVCFGSGETIQNLRQTPKVDDTPTLNPSAVIQALEEDIDPITKAIREQVIAKQTEILKDAMGQGELSKEKFEEYLKNPENKEAIHAKIDSDPALQKQFQDLEVAAYANIHNNKAFNFKTVAWDGRDNPADVRTQTVLNAGGEEVCKLTETTIKNPITLGDKTIQNYRKIDFPLNLEKANGPMHVSMAVRDENGNKVPQNKAVYFTAHYDQAGKLTEVSSPVPLKFAGTDDNAIGYVEREGKIYTLPVTKKNYTQMMLEVAKNKGHGIDISKETPVIAEDEISVAKRTEKGAVLAKEDPVVSAEIPVVSAEIPVVSAEIPVVSTEIPVVSTDHVVNPDTHNTGTKIPDPTAIASSIRDSLSSSKSNKPTPKPMLSKEKAMEVQNSYLEAYNDSSKTTSDRVKIVEEMAKRDDLHKEDKGSILNALQKQGSVAKGIDNVLITNAIVKARENITATKTKPLAPKAPSR